MEGAPKVRDWKSLDCCKDNFLNFLISVSHLFPFHQISILPTHSGSSIFPTHPLSPSLPQTHQDFSQSKLVNPLVSVIFMSTVPLKYLQYSPVRRHPARGRMIHPLLIQSPPKQLHATQKRMNISDGPKTCLVHWSTWPLRTNFAI